MNFLSDWFIQLDPTLRFYWGIAIFASIVVIIQMTMSFAGMGDIDSGDADVDFSTDTDSLDNAGSMHLLSIRNIFYFLLGFGWAGVSLWSTIPNTIDILWDSNRRKTCTIIKGSPADARHPLWNNDGG